MEKLIEMIEMIEAQGETASLEATSPLCCV